MRISCVVVVGLVLAAWGVAGAEAREAQLSPVKLDISSQPLGDALNEFAKQARLQVVLYSRISEGLMAPQIVGNLSPQNALGRLLEKTGLRFEYIDADTIGIFAEGERGASSAAVEPVADASPMGAMRLAQAENSSSDSAATATGQSPEGNSNAMDSKQNSEDEKLEEIVVTAQKREERIRDVPMSVAAMSGAQLEAAKISSTLDLSFAVPGLTVAETGPGRQIIAIRGLASERGSSSLTGLYLDEMPVSGAQDGAIQSYIDLRTIDLERVEVLKGPQGTLFGEGSVGGALRFITKDPRLQAFESSLSTTFYSSADGGFSKEVIGIANLPVVQDKLGLRIAATYEDKAGWIDQPSIGREDINDNELYNVRVKGLWAVTPQLAVKGMAIIHRNEGGGSNIVNQEPFEDSNFLQAYGGTGNRDAPTGFVDEYQLYNLTATYDFEFAQLLSSTSYGDMDSSQSLTQLTGSLPTPSFELLLRDYDQHAQIVSQELRLTSAGSGPFNWTIGAFYKDSEMSRTFVSGFDFVFFGGTLNQVAAEGIQAGLTPTGKSKSLAEYADVSYAVTERFKIGGGLRYFEDERETFDATNIAATAVTADFDAVTFRAYASYAPTDDVNVYVNVGDGFRSGGFNEPANVPLGAPATYDPESVLSYEAGIKAGLFESRFSFDVAAFYSEYQDMQDNTVIISPVDGETAIGFTANGQAARLKGVDWTLSGRAMANLTLGLSGTVIDTEITEVAPGSPFFLRDPINFVPEYNLAATANYKFDWAAAAPGFFMVDYNLQGKSFSTVRGNGLGVREQHVAPEVAFLNISTGVQLKDWELSLFAKNLTDERETIRAGWSGLTAQTRPRTAGITIRKNF